MGLPTAEVPCLAGRRGSIGSGRAKTELVLLEAGDRWEASDVSRGRAVDRLRLRRGDVVAVAVVVVVDWRAAAGGYRK